MPGEGGGDWGQAPILSTVAGGGYQLLNGTSEAAAFVTGAAALFLLAETGDLNGDGLIDNEDTRLLLTLSATDLGPAGRDPTYGYGLVNAGMASLDGSRPDVAIREATATGQTVTIEGSGFGAYAAGSITSVKAADSTSFEEEKKLL